MMALQHKNTQFQEGFSLIELMVGLTIGLLVTLIVSQTMGVFDTQKRTTTGTADAQTNGNIGLFTIQRDVKQAGYAMIPQGKADTPDSSLDCTTVNVNSSGVTSIYPVDITDGVSDSITVRYGNAPFGGAVTSLDNDSTNTDRILGSNLGCSVNDIAIIMSGATCNLTKITAVSTVNTNTDSKTVRLSDAVGNQDNDFACLGPWTEVTYRVNNSNLERVVGGTATIVMNDVVNIQAQYGVSTTVNSNQINQWVNPSGATWAAPTPANRKLIKALRVALVTRNPQIDQSVVATDCANGPCAWSDVPVGGAILTASPAPTIDLSGTANWNRYHYRVFETVIPLRNQIWAKDTL